MLKVEHVCRVFAQTHYLVGQFLINGAHGKVLLETKLHTRSWRSDLRYR